MLSEPQSPQLSQAGHFGKESSRTLLPESTDSSSYHYDELEAESEETMGVEHQSGMGRVTSGMLEHP